MLVNGFSFSSDLSKSLQKAIEDDRFVIVLENLSARRRNRVGANVDILLTIEFPHSKQQLGFAFDRKKSQGRFCTNCFLYLKKENLHCIQNGFVYFSDKSKKRHFSNTIFDSTRQFYVDCEKRPSLFTL